MEKTYTSISVVVPVHNGAEYLQEVLTAVMGELQPCDRVVVVDDRSSDNSAALAGEMGAEVIQNSGRPGAAGARNSGAFSSETDWILFLDSDAVAPDGWRKKLLKLIEEGADAIQAIYGSKIRGSGAATFYKNFYYHYTFTRRISGSFISGCGTFFFAVRREIFSELQGFDDMISGASIEDADFAARLTGAGYRILLAPGIEVLHLREYTLIDLLGYDWKMMKSKALYMLRRDSRHAAPSISMATPKEMLPTITGAAGVWVLAFGLLGFAAGWSPGLPAAVAGLLIVVAGHAKFWFSSVRRGGRKGLLASIMTFPDLLLIIPAVLWAVIVSMSGRKY